MCSLPYLAQFQLQTIIDTHFLLCSYCLSKIDYVHLHTSERDAIILSRNMRIMFGDHKRRYLVVHVMMFDCVNVTRRV